MSSQVSAISRTTLSAVRRHAASMQKSQIDSRSSIASWDQISDLLLPTMAFFGALDKLVYVQFPSVAGAKRPFAFIDLKAKAAELFDMRKQLPADGLLIGFR
jgi:hypothetical protein